MSNGNLLEWQKTVACAGAAGPCAGVYATGSKGGMFWQWWKVGKGSDSCSKSQENVIHVEKV